MALRHRDWCFLLVPDGPWGMPDQADFLNQVIESGIRYSPHDLLEKITGHGKGHGRKTLRPGGDRGD